MDFLKVSDKTTTPYRNNSLFGLNQQQMETHPHPHVITPYAGNGVMGCYYYYPFTNAQLKELERQAMIYKYMIASVPVPFDLLVSSSSSSPCNNKNAAGDLEPGRCRRTDGKKWRCSKEVVSNHKYCERHLHRGRPRSRKHVELPYSRPSNNIGGSEKNRVLSSTKDTTVKPKEVSSARAFPLSAANEQENKYLNFIDVWSDGVRSSEKQSTPASSSPSGNPSLYSLDLSMGGNSLMGHDEMGLRVIGSGRDGYGPYGGVVSSSLDEMSSWLASTSATPGGPLAEILRPNPSSAFSGETEANSLTATPTPSSSPSRVVKKVTGSVSDESSQL
ncbi:Growth-regulating factor 7 [Hirschfeldia incana]|nr:Growth-regulating factor 7 [Hirschfeldia incana]